MSVESLAFVELGTTIQVFVTEPSARDSAEEISRRLVHEMDMTCSRFRTDSELSSVNANPHITQSVSPLFAEVLAQALRAAEMTNGAVDPTLGKALKSIGYDRDFSDIDTTAIHDQIISSNMGRWRDIRYDQATQELVVPYGVELDFGSIAKALLADHIAETIFGETGSGTLANLGGDIALAGPSPTEGWRIQIAEDHKEPIDPGGYVLILNDGALATSSTTVRRWETDNHTYHHIIDPATGLPAIEWWRTVSVIAANCVDANIASTAALVWGRDAKNILKMWKLPTQFIRFDGVVEHCCGWPVEHTHA